jgi:hypothetical protein
MARFNKREQDLAEGASSKQATVASALDEFIAVHEQVSQHRASLWALTDAAERLAIAERIQDYIASIDDESKVAGFRILSPMINELEASVLLAIWDCDGNKLIIANEMVYLSPCAAVLANLVVSLDDGECISQLLLSKESFDTLLRTLLAVQSPTCHATARIHYTGHGSESSTSMPSQPSDSFRPIFESFGEARSKRSTYGALSIWQSRLRTGTMSCACAVSNVHALRASN